MSRWWQILVVVCMVAVPVVGSAAEPAVEPEPEAVEVLGASWVMDVPVAGDHAVALVRKVTDQIDQADFAEGEWRRYKVGMSDVQVTMTLLHRYDGAPSDFPTPGAGAEEWSIKLTNAAYAATIEWTTLPGDRSQIHRIFTHDDRLNLLPRSSSDPRTGMQAALQHARLDALHPHASLVGVLRGGSPVWQPSIGESFALTDHGQSRLPSLLIVASGYRAHRSTLGRDATMGPACVGWQVCGEQRGVAAQK